ncbi:MAG TPA: hypothetical protein VFC33_02110 [Acidimicrobiia bacterium]|nr:hypothetical protein [Acidimicrobiia bacterium]
MEEHHIRERLHDALHRGHRKATEEDVAELTAIVLTIVTELTGELAVVIAELAERLEALEARTA